MAKENDDIRDIIDKQKKEANLDKSSIKNNMIPFYLLIFFIFIYILLR